MAKRSFISKQEFDEKVKIQKKEFQVKRWADIEESIIYLIDTIEEKYSVKYGECYILHIEDDKGKIDKVWAPSRLVTQIRERRKSDEIPYFVSLGQEVLNKNKTINRFELTFKKDKDAKKELFIKKKDS